jgi:hypothetical protein
MKTILSFGAGVQTTALTILAAQGKVKIDAVVFADTKGEKPETYWYMENYTVPLIESLKIPFITVRSKLKSRQPDLYGWLFRNKDIPGVMGKRECSWNFKRMPISREFPKAEILIGFSSDEGKRLKTDSYPLFEAGISGADCTRIISDFGWPVPVKSSCFFCPFQRPYEWNWLKRNHLDLFQKALDLEANFYTRKPYFRNEIGLMGGKPLWKFAKGIQQEFLLQENSCWTGACGH